MTAHVRSLLLVLVLVAGVVLQPTENRGQDAKPAPAGARPPATDLYGDPLPPAGLVRLGSHRLRYNGMIRFTPKGDGVAIGGAVVQLTTGKIVQRFYAPVEYMGDYRFTAPDRVRVAGVSSQTVFSCWEVADGQQPKQFFKAMEEFAIRAAAFSPEGDEVALVGSDGTVRLREVSSGKEIRRLGCPKSEKASLLYSPDGRFLAVRLSDRKEASLSLIDLKSGKRVELADGQRHEVFSLAFSPDGRTFAGGSYYGKFVRLWDTATGKELLALPEEFGTRTVAFSPDGKTLARAGEAGVVYLNEAATGKAAGRFASEGNTYHVAFSPDGKTLVASASVFFGRTRVWDLASGRELLTFPTHDRDVDAIAFAPDGAVVATSSSDSTVRLWEAATGKHLLTIGEKRPRESRRQGPRIAFTADALVVADGTVIAFWDVKAKKELRRFESLEAEVASLAISPDGATIAVLCVDRDVAPEATDSLFHYLTVHLRDAATGKLKLAIPRLAPYSGRVLFAPDGKSLLVAEPDHSANLTVYDAASGKKRFGIEAPGGPTNSVVYDCAWSPDGKRIAAVTQDQKLHLWDASAGRHQTSSELPRERFFADSHSLAFSPDGKLLVTVGLGRASYFESETGRLLKSDEGGEARPPAFSPDGKRLATGHGGGVVLIREVPPGLLKP